MVPGLFTIVLAADSPLKWSGVLNIRHTQRELLAGVLAVRAVHLDSEYVGQGVRNRNRVRRPDPAERKIGLTRRFAGKVDPVELSGCRGLREPAAAAIGITRKGRNNVDRRRTDPSLGKGYAVRAPSSGTLFGRAGDRGHG